MGMWKQTANCRVQIVDDYCVCYVLLILMSEFKKERYGMLENQQEVLPCTK